MHTRLVAAADKKLFHSHFVGNLLERLLGVADRKRHQNGARPRRNFVDVEPEPVGKQHDLRRNRRHRIVIVLPEETEIDLGKCIDFGHAAHFKNLLAGARQRGMIGRESRQLQPEVGLHRSADVGRTAGVNAPAAVFILVVQDVARGLVKAFLAARAQQGMQQDVIGFEGGVGFQFPAPVPSSCCCEKRYLRAASTATATRLPRSSIFPNRICGAEAELYSHTGGGFFHL